MLANSKISGGYLNNLKKGFTLIELLAVIVILAIIALIATPIILNMIDSARKNAAVDSAYGYIEAIEYNNSMSMLNSTKYPLIEDGEDIDVSTIGSLELKGTKPESGKISISKKIVTKANICINSYNVEYDGKEAKATSKCDNKINNNPFESGNIIVSDELKKLLENTNHNITVEDILTSETAMRDILSNEKNANYIIENYGNYSSDILSNKNILNMFLDDEKLSNLLINNSVWTKEILKNEKIIKNLDESNPIKTPTMTSNTSPSGEAIFSSEYSDRYAYYPAYKVFDKNLDGTSYWSVGAGLSYKNQYVGYCFEDEVWVYKMDIQFPTAWKGRQDTDFVVEASNDKNSDSWNTIKSGLHESTTKQTIIMDNYNEKYKCYRIKMLSEITQYGNNNTVIYELEFYGI